MYRNSRPSLWKRGSQHRTDMVFTGVDWHEVPPVMPLLTAPTHFPSTQKKSGRVAVRNDVDHRVATFRRRGRMLRSVGLHLEFNVLRSAAYFRFRSPSYPGRAHSTTVERLRRWSSRLSPINCRIPLSRQLGNRQQFYVPRDSCVTSPIRSLTLESKPPVLV